MQHVAKYIVYYPSMLEQPLKNMELLPGIDMIYIQSLEQPSSNIMI